MLMEVSIDVFNKFGTAHHYNYDTVRYRSVPMVVRPLCYTIRLVFVSLVWKTLYGASLAIDVIYTVNCRGAPRDTHNL